MTKKIAIKKLKGFKEFLLLAQKTFIPEIELTSTRTLETKISKLFGSMAGGVDDIIKELK